MDTSADSKHHVLGLDVVRFWAACSVAWFHLGFWSWASPPDLPFRAGGGHVRFEGLAPFAWFGWSGVETFFVLSGFVICASAGRSTPYRFLRGRIARLYPAVWICAPLTAIVALWTGLTPPDELQGAYLRSLVILPAGPWVDSVYRTLAVEIVFYALVLILLFARAFRRIEIIAIALGAYSIAFWVLGSFVDVHGLAPIAILNFSKYGIFFALGMMIWSAKDKGPTSLRCLVIAALVAACTTEVWLVARGMAPYVARPPVLVPVVVWLATIGVVLFSVAYDGVVHRWAGPRTKWLRTIGLMTYPLYLLHDVVGSSVLRTAPQLGQAGALAGAFGVSLGLSWLVVQLEPCLRRPLLALLDTTAKAVAGRQAAPERV